MEIRIISLNCEITALVEHRKRIGDSIARCIKLFGGGGRVIQFPDIKNFLNLLNSDWGIYKTVNNTSLLSYKGGAYQFQKNGGKKLTDTYSNLNSFNSTYSIQFSVRYIFN